MGRTFQRCDNSVNEMIGRLINKYYPDLLEAEVTFDLLFAHASAAKEGQDKGPTLMLHGYPCAATVKINSLEQRVKGMADCTIKIDGDQWPDWDDERQQALLDHELYHLVLKRDSEGQIKADDVGRPLLKLRPHDWQTGGFATIAERHGEASFEKTEMKLVVDAYGQLLFPWG